MVIEYRNIQDAELRADEDNRRITGYGIVFNSDSQPMRIWDDQTGRILDVVEQITPASMRDADMSDLISAYNHDFSRVLGRTVAGTMKISRDAKGVRYSADVPNTSYGNDVLELVRRGDLRGSSFVFTMDYEAGYDIQERNDGTLVASPVKITKIYEMGPVINPAYPETTAENRAGMLEKAVKRFLAEKDAEKRTEEQGEEEKRTEDMADATQAPEHTEEARTITYPFPAGYYRHKAKAKKRV